MFTIGNLKMKCIKFVFTKIINELETMNLFFTLGFYETTNSLCGDPSEDGEPKGFFYGDIDTTLVCFDAATCRSTGGSYPPISTIGTPSTVGVKACLHGQLFRCLGGHVPPVFTCDLSGGFNHGGYPSVFLTLNPSGMQRPV